MSNKKTKLIWKRIKNFHDKLQELLQLCNDMKKKSYCPYSKFRVGAALLTDDGSVFTGCNVENASYGLSICAERTAIVKAVSEGHRKYKALFLACHIEDGFGSPCGACRQFLVEFGIDWDVYLVKPDLTYKKLTAGDLLPMAFVPDSLLKTDKVTDAT